MLFPTSLSRPQRIGYILSCGLLGGGWVFLLVLTHEWSSPHWSRSALVLQAAALIVAVLLMPHVPARRLVAYPLILATSIYLLDTTLPPPNLPSGWPREIIPRLVLLGLLADCLRTILWRRGLHRGMDQYGQPVALEDAARLLGLTELELRIRLQQRSIGITIDTIGCEYVSADDLHRLYRGRKPAWWQLYGWVLLMSSLLLFIGPLVLSAAWEMAAQVVWSVLTLGGMWLWVWKNQEALAEDDRAKHPRQRSRERDDGTIDRRTIPLTPVQRRYLAVMERETVRIEQNPEEGIDA
jgi:hypothetical protein